MRALFHSRAGTALLALAAIGAAATLLPAARGATVAPAAVTIDNFTFGPASVTVPAGTTITWTNRDDIPHTVTAADTPRRFRSPPLDTGDHFAVTFTQPGTYRYICSLHPMMQGTVVVQ